MLQALQALPAWGAVVITALTLAFTIRSHNKDQQAARREKLLNHKREILFSALRVIDFCYANQSFYGNPPIMPRRWDVQLARDADNGMRIYCEYPETIAAFRKALGFWNPHEDEKAPQLDIKALDDFRKQVAKELDLREPIGFDEKLVWINSLSGTLPANSSAPTSWSSSTSHNFGRPNGDK